LEQMKGMTIIVRTVARWVRVPIFLFGIYIIAFGDVSPGGGFAGGAILASVYVLLMLAFGRDVVNKELPPAWALRIACLALFAFVAMAVSGLLFDSDGFFWNFIYQEWLADTDATVHFIAAGTVSLAELWIGLAVGGLVFLAIWSLSTLRLDISACERM
jgi:energy-converting hydrogenase B subunit I